MQQNIGRKVFPGLKIAKHQEQNLGYGLYLREGSVYASVIGTIKTDNLFGSHSIYYISNNLKSRKIGPAIGDYIVGKVVKVKEEECTLEILQINNIYCQSRGKSRSLEATIRKENVREKMIDSVVMMECFREKDIVRGKVISLGDSIRSIYLSTAGEELGVLIAQNEETGRLMLPFDWSTMIDPQEMIKESRKVCRPEIK